MLHISEDTITQAVIAGHAGAADARLRDVVTSLVQHLHAFAREVRLTEDEWFAGIRFLTDFLAGDVYFKVHREGHNLDRCRTQFKLVESIEQQETRMNQLVEQIG